MPKYDTFIQSASQRLHHSAGIDNKSAGLSLISSITYRYVTMQCSVPSCNASMSAKRKKVCNHFSAAYFFP